MVYATFDENGTFTNLVPDEESLREQDREESETIKNLLQKLKKKNRIARQTKAGFFISYDTLLLALQVPRAFEKWRS